MISTLHSQLGDGAELDCTARIVDVPMWLCKMLYDVLREHIDREFARGLVVTPDLEQIPSHHPVPETIDHVPSSDQLCELFPQYEALVIERLLTINKNNFELSLDQLSSGISPQDIMEHVLPDNQREDLGSNSRPMYGQELPQTIQRESEQMTVVCSKKRSGLNRSESPKSTDTGNVPLPDSNESTQVVNEFFERAGRYRKLAEGLPNRRHPAFCQYLRMAQECVDTAKRIQAIEDDTVANSAQEVLDLHGFEVVRAIRVLQNTIRIAKSNRPTQKRLEVITGIGKRNARNKTPLKNAVELWLRQKHIPYEKDPFNQGALVIELHNVVVNQCT